MLMKKISQILLIALSSIILFCCSYDDTDIWSEIDGIKTELAKINGQVSTLKTLVDALNKGKVITQLEEMSDGKGYVITFNDGKKIKITNGQDAPKIGVKEEQGTYYWTLSANGKENFLLDKDNNKIPVTGNDGKTPQLSVDEEGYWTVNSQRVIGADGSPVKAKGEKGDSFFKNVIEAEESVTIELTNGTTIVLPKLMDNSLVFVVPEGGKTYFYFDFDEEKQLNLKTANIVSAEIIMQPEGWSVSLDLKKKTVTVRSPKQKAQSYSEGKIKIQGVDKNGLVYLAVAEVFSGVDFTDPNGTFVVCEGNMTSVNGMLVYYDKKGKEYINVFKKANNGLEIGNVVQDMYIANGKIYLLTQNGSNMGGAGRFVVCDAKTMKMEYADPLIIKTPDGAATWPQHLVVTSEKKAFVQYAQAGMEATSGIVELTLGEKSVTIKNTVDGTFGAFTKKGATKARMVFSKGKIYAGLGENLGIINPENSTLEKKLSFEGRQVKGVVKGANGNIFFALASPYTGKQNWGTVFTSTPQMVEMSHEGTIINTVELPEGMQLPVATWSPSVNMGASFTDPHIYFMDTHKFSATTATRYNYQTQKFEVNYVSFDGYDSIYGIMGVHPTTQKLWVSRSTNGYTTGTVYLFDASGTSPALENTYVYPTQMGASPAGIDFGYRFTEEWINK